MLCVEDYIDALLWCETVGGLKGLIKRSKVRGGIGFVLIQNVKTKKNKKMDRSPHGARNGVVPRKNHSTQRIYTTCTLTHFWYTRVCLPMIRRGSLFDADLWWGGEGGRFFFTKDNLCYIYIWRTWLEIISDFECACDRMAYLLVPTEAALNFFSVASCAPSSREPARRTVLF